MIKVSVLIPVWNQESLVINALNHIPRRDDIEIIVRDDGSTDSTLPNLLSYKDAHPELNLTIVSNGENKGLYYTSNRLLEQATGEYFQMHNSDDYVLTDVYNDLVDQLDGSMDILCMDLKVNSGEVWEVNEQTYRTHCAQVMRLIKRSFVDGMSWNEQMKAAADWYFAEEMLKRNPVTVFSHKVCYMYNFPRKGSLVDLRARGIIGE